MLGRPDPTTHLMRNVSFDTCVYHRAGMALLFEVIGVDGILFGSEMLGAVRGVDASTGHYFDDTKRYVDALGLSDAQRAAVYSGNARRVFPRLDSLLAGQGR
jgi:4-oxalmesaconate hydratase